VLPWTPTEGGVPGTDGLTSSVSDEMVSVTNSLTTGNVKQVKWARNPGDGSGNREVFVIGTFPEAILRPR